MKPVYERDKGDIQADMYAYVLAAAHHKMKHVRLNNFMVSCVECGEEGWPWVDTIKKMSCHNPQLPKGSKRPGFLHAASHFKVSRRQAESLSPSLSLDICCTAGARP